MRAVWVLNGLSPNVWDRVRSGRSPDWLKFKNPEAPAVKREAEEDGGRILTDVVQACDRYHSGEKSRVRKFLASKGDSTQNNRRLIMSVQPTNEIRDLTADELNAVSGGVAATDVGYFIVVAGFAGMVALTIGALWDVIFGD